jgi:regulator of protease activity HflC (stomatin/prohibitin superfamily)
MTIKSTTSGANARHPAQGQDDGPVIAERPAFRTGGFMMLALLIAMLATVVWLFVVTAIDAQANPDAPPAALWAAIGLLVLFGIGCRGLYTVQPNEARVLVLFGRYVGSVRESGFWWSNPFADKRRISLKVRNFNSDKVKVNDAQGNPIEIAAVVVWRVVDSARAVFDVERYEHFVSIQSETAIRALASGYPYDAHEEGTESLRGSPAEVAAELARELNERLEVAGVRVLDARISHLAYSPEIAQAMLRRQQANAVIAARQQIVEGAVGMVEMALRRLSERHVVDLDEERKAAMVSNLMVVLVSESETHPVLNAGTLY